MSWHKLAQNPQAIENLYKTVPQLENVELFSIKLNREGSQLQIKFDLPTFPENPSPRWNKNDNTIQLQLSFWTIKNFKAQGWETKMTVKIEVKYINKNLKVVISNSDLNFKFSFESEFFQIVKITPYIQSNKNLLS